MPGREVAAQEQVEGAQDPARAAPRARAQPKALKILRARLLERARSEQQSEIAANRKAMVGSGDRSEKIRTYNFPQSRVTDHRVNVTLHTLDRVLDGEIDPIVDALVTRQQAEALAPAD